jgi:malonyl CoA-acyl carrier protein transacylase
MKAFKRIIAVIAILTVITVSFFAIYTADYYHASPKAVSASVSSKGVTVTQSGDGLVFTPVNPKAGLVFYPGGKVEYTSYSPLMKKLAQDGIFCVLLKMPANLAILDMNAAKDIPGRYPEIKRWFTAGHSLGGVAASACVSENSELFEGLILLAAYSTSDLSAVPVRVLSVYGSCDKVIDMEAYKENSVNLPPETNEYIIDGGCHAYFGSYGAQKGDGKSEITDEKQIELTSEKIIEFIGG